MMKQEFVSRFLPAAMQAGNRFNMNPAIILELIAYSRYISEVNGDNRAAYQSMLIRIERSLLPFLPLPGTAIEPPVIH